jgi:hypothetical protein
METTHVSDVRAGSLVRIKASTPFWRRIPGSSSYIQVQQASVGEIFIAASEDRGAVELVHSQLGSVFVSDVFLEVIE